MNNIAKKKKCDKKEKQQLTYKLFIACVIFALLNLLSSALRSKLLNFLSLFPAIYIFVGFIHLMMEE